MTYLSYMLSEENPTLTMKYDVPVHPVEGPLTEEETEALDQMLAKAQISAAGKERLRQIFIKHKATWTRSGVGQAKGACHRIELLEDRPVCLPPREIPRKYRKFVEEEVENMIRDGVMPLPRPLGVLTPCWLRRKMEASGLPWTTEN